MAGQLQEHIIEGRASQSDVVDLNTCVTKNPYDFGQALHPTLRRNRDPAQMIVDGMLVAAEQGSRQFELITTVDDDLDPLTTDLRFQFIRRSARDDPAVIDHGNAVGQFVCFFQVLGGEEQRRSGSHPFPNRFPHADAAARIEPGRRFVEHEQPWPPGQGAGEVEPATHTARVGLGGPIGRVGQLELLEQFGRARNRISL